MSPDAYRAATPDERLMFDRLLSVAFPGRDEIATQIANVRVKTIDADGNLDLMVTSGERAAVERRIPVEGEAEDEDGMTIHVLLHVVDGFAKELEIYREDSGPVRSKIDPNQVRVVVI